MDRTRLLICDLDGTLLGDDAALQRFAHWVTPRRGELKLVYNSGRFVRSIAESVRTSGLPDPDAVIGGVGTQIRSWPDLEPVGNWIDGRPGWWPLTITSILAEYPQAAPQPAEFLSHYKISYFLHDAPPALLDEIRDKLRAEGCRVDLVYSSNRDLDILPEGVNKGSASAWLADCWGIPHDRVLVSGDSGNDQAMFSNGFRGIVVGNAHPELKALTGGRIYQASRPYAAGVLEGVEFWLNAN